MKKLINKKTIQYIKQGYVLYGGNGLDFGEPNFWQNFDSKYFWKSGIKKKFTELYRKKYPKYLQQSLDQDFDQFLNNNFAQHGGFYWNIHTPLGRRVQDIMETEDSLKEAAPDYYRDQRGQLWQKVHDNGSVKVDELTSDTLNSFQSIKHPGFIYVKVKEDIKDSRVNIPAVLSSTQSSSTTNSDPDDKIADLTEIQGTALPHKYGKGEVYYYKVKTKDGDRWAARYVNPTNGQKPGWYWVAEGSTGYDKQGKHNKLTGGQWVPEEGSSENESSENGTSESQTSSSQTSSTQTSSDGPAPTEFTAASQETDRRDIVPSVIQSTMSPQMTPATTTLLPKVTPVARPSNMPLMNRGDVRYTISDITGSSPYFSSDIELVNGLAGAPDNNMFKQALMNRLGMDKWDSSTALNRLNFLGIKGSIGGSDRRRIRNLINNGTTVAGKIRK